MLTDEFGVWGLSQIFNRFGHKDRMPDSVACSRCTSQIVLNHTGAEKGTMIRLIDTSRATANSVHAVRMRSTGREESLLCWRDAGMAGPAKRADRGIAKSGHYLGTMAGAELVSVLVVDDIRHRVQPVRVGPVALGPASHCARWCAHHVEEPMA